MWKTAKLEEVCSITSGNSIAEKQKSDVFTNVIGTPYVATKDVGFSGKIDYHNGIYIPDAHLTSFKVSPANSTLVCAEGGSAGRKIAYSDRDCCFVNKLFSISPKSGISPKFIYYYALSKEFQSQFKESLHGLIGGVSLNKIKRFKISFPPLAEQQRIVEKLDRAFEEIDRAIEAIELATRESANLRESILSEIFNDDSFPEFQLKDVCEFQGGSQPPKSDFEYVETEENIRLIQIRDYKSDNHIVFIPKSKAKRFCGKSDVMIGRYGPPIFQILRGLEGSYNVALMKAVPKRGLDNDYLFYFLKNRKIQNYVIAQSIRAAGQSGVNKDALEPYPINLPPIEDQNKKVALAKQCEELADSIGAINKQKASLLTRLKSAILAQELKGPES